MDSLGFTVHLNKSVLFPTKQIVFLGFLLCSDSMTVCLTPERKNELIAYCKGFLNKSKCTIRQFAKLIGLMVASEPAVEHAPLFYKPLEKIKEFQLRINKGNFDRYMKINSKCKDAMQWWIDNLTSSFKPVTQKGPDLILYTDASRLGWGAFNKSENRRTGGQWSVDEQSRHINILEF